MTATLKIGRRRGARLLVIAFLLSAWIPTNAWGSQVVKLKVAFTPDQLGASTTVHLSFTITTPTGGIPSPMSDVNIALPAGMGLGTTNLGEATCTTTILLAKGPESCSPNSRMGFGKAMVQIPVNPYLEISASITVYMGPPVEKHTTMLIYSETTHPVSSQFVFPTELLPGAPPFGAHLDTLLAPIPTWPEGPNAAVVHLETTLGPSGLTYYTRVHGERVSYSPTGMAVPERCPRGGFPFDATYLFQDGSTTMARAVVPCPPLRRHTSAH